MNRLIALFSVLFFAFFASCSNDDGAGRNRFRFGERTLTLNRAYYFFVDTDFMSEEFIIVLTDGSLDSFSIFTNAFVFGPETRNAIIITAKTFDEERNVAEKAPIDGIIINDLNKDKPKEKTTKIKKVIYSIKVADFYYEKSAQQMINRIKNETKIIN